MQHVAEASDVVAKSCLGQCEGNDVTGQWRRDRLPREPPGKRDSIKMIAQGLRTPVRAGRDLRRRKQETGKPVSMDPAGKDVDFVVLWGLRGLPFLRSDRVVPQDGPYFFEL